MNRFVFATALAAAASVVGTAAETSISPSVAVEVTRDKTRDNDFFINKGFVRGEVQFGLKTGETAGGLLHLRLQSNLADAGGIPATVRQCYWDIPASILTVRLGRWYESYTPGGYFGRFLYGVGSIKTDVTVPGGQAVKRTIDPATGLPTDSIYTTKVKKSITIGAGSGSMRTNYNVLDGIDLTLNAVPKKVLDVHLGLITADTRFEQINSVLGVTSSPIEPLSLGAWGSFGVNVPEGSERVHAMAITASYTIIERLMPFVEVSITDLAEAGDNVWLMGGLDIPAGKVLDLLRFECEFKKDRFNGDYLLDSDNPDFAWLVIVAKKVKAVTFDMNIGADPKSLGSLTPAEIGAHLRMTLTL